MEYETFVFGVALAFASLSYLLWGFMGFVFTFILVVLLTSHPLLEAMSKPALVGIDGKTFVKGFSVIPIGVYAISYLQFSVILKLLFGFIWVFLISYAVGGVKNGKHNKDVH